MELTERQERILKTVVEAYIATARPVGSSAVVTSSDLGVSSATVRNEMAVLEEMGHISHLHTSGGRVPTNLGYQYYVQRLMGQSRLPSTEALTIRHQFHQTPGDPQEWLKLAATVMATRMHNVGLATAPKSAEVKLRHLEVISIHDNVALLIVVLQDGTVLQEMLTLDEARSQEELSVLADRLSRALIALSAPQVEAKIANLTGLETTIAGVVAQILGRRSARHAQVFHAGLSDLIRQPEFHERRPGEREGVASERVRQVVEFLQQGLELERLVSGIEGKMDVQIVIGGGDASAELSDYSFVLGGYGDGEHSIGYLGVVGPTRMEYPRAVALVRYMTGLMSGLINAY